MLTCLNGSELGYGLGSFRHGVLGQLSREDQADSRLDLARGDSRLLVVEGQSCSLSRHLDERGEGQ